MKELLIDTTVTCPSCWEPHTVTIDVTEEEHHFIEDCRVCCNPIRIDFELSETDELTDVSASAP